MSSALFYLYLSSIFFSVVMAFISRKYLESRKLFIMLPFLMYVFIQEVVLGFSLLFNISISNAVVYNLYQPLSVIVIAFIYFRTPFMNPVRKLITVITLLYLLVTIINYSFLESILANSSYLPLVRGFIITLFALLALFRYFHLDNGEEEEFWRPLLWITIGIAIFYPVISISLNFQKYLSHGDYTLYGFKIYQLIPRVMSIFMYGCFSYAFYLCRKKRSVSSIPL